MQKEQFLKSWLMAALLVLTSSCESAPPPAVPINRKIPDVRDDFGLVIVMRYGEGLRMTTGSVPIYVDNKEVFSVKDWRYTYFWVTPGPHKIKAEWSVLEKPWFENGHFDASEVGLDIEAGKAYFLNYQIVQDATPPSPLANTLVPFSKSHVLSAGLILETHDVGREKLSHCSFQENRW
jgi:hypothetical protein